MQSVAEQIKFNWNYQHRLGTEVLVPNLMKQNVFKQGDNVFEVGCGEGGVLTAFVKAGVGMAVGTDINEERIREGKQFILEQGLEIHLTSHNILQNEPEKDWIKNFDLVLLRDVIEHLQDTNLALKNIKPLIKPGGFLFVTFPPFYSPFGAHQHTVKNFWGNFPYLQFLPQSVFFKLISSGRPNDVQEVKKISEIKLSVEKFKTAAQETGYSIYHEEFYLLRPVFKMKFGLPELKLPSIVNGEIFHNVFSTEAAFILQSK